MLITFREATDQRVADTDLGCNDDLITLSPESFADQALAFSLAIAGCGFEKVHPSFERFPQCVDGAGVISTMHGSANSGAAHPQLGNAQTGFAQDSVVHVPLSG